MGFWFSAFFFVLSFFFEKKHQTNNPPGYFKECFFFKTFVFFEVQNFKLKTQKNFPKRKRAAGAEVFRKLVFFAIFILFQNVPRRVFSF